MIRFIRVPQVPDAGAWDGCREPRGVKLTPLREHKSNRAPRRLKQNTMTPSAPRAKPSAGRGLRVLFLSVQQVCDHANISVTDIPMTATEPLTPTVFHILLSLVDGEKHGYGIMQEVAARTGNDLIMGPGTLYGTLKRMLDSGLVEECGERPDPTMGEGRRRYYRLSRLGRRAARSEAERLDAVVQVARDKSLLRRPQRA